MQLNLTKGDIVFFLKPIPGCDTVMVFRGTGLSARPADVEPKDWKSFSRALFIPTWPYGNDPDTKFGQIPFRDPREVAELIERVVDPKTGEEKPTLVRTP